MFKDKGKIMENAYKCPHCNKHIINNTILDRCIDYINEDICQVSADKQCSICGKIYNVKIVYKLDHEELAGI